MEDVPLKYSPTAKTDVPARHMDENIRAPTVRCKQSRTGQVGYKNNYHQIKWNAKSQLFSIVK